MSAPTIALPQAPLAPALRPYRIRTAGLDYIALAASSSQAVIDAMALHGVQTIVAQPVNLGGARLQRGVA